MPEDARPAQERPRETSGEYLFRVLKPAGAVLVLLLAAAFLLVCFTGRHDPLLDYRPALDAGAYASQPEALREELERELLPYFPGSSARVEDGKVRVSAPAETMDRLRETLETVFSGAPIEFEVSEA